MDIFPCDNLSDNRLMQLLQFAAARALIAKNIFKRGYETDNKVKKLLMGCCSLLPSRPLYSLAVLKKQSSTKRVHTFFGGSCRFQKGTYPRVWLQELRQMQFEGIPVLISAHYDELLTTMYGDYMTLPPEEDRKCKVHAILVDTEKNYTEYRDYRKGMRFDVYTRSIR